jgi:hypothetical protein
MKQNQKKKKKHCEPFGLPKGEHILLIQSNGDLPMTASTPWLAAEWCGSAARFPCRGPLSCAQRLAENKIINRYPSIMWHYLRKANHKTFAKKIFFEAIFIKYKFRNLHGNLTQFDVKKKADK